jgi:tetratricopeptide (TPR) repeat protein
MKKIKICAYTIALNEEKHVMRWLEGTRDADLRVVADTGSTDKTVALLQAAPNVIVHKINVKPFRFDDARNAALALIPDDIDVCLSLDMDEIPEKDFFHTVRETWEPGTGRAWVWWYTGNKWKNNNRLHAREGYRWIKPCHEVTFRYAEGEEKTLDYDLTVFHKPDDSKARTYYLPMLQAAVHEDPRDARMWAYLTREYFFHEKWEKVIESAFSTLQAGGWYVERSAVCRAAGEASQKLSNKDNALKWFQRAIKENQTELEPWFSFAQFSYTVGNWQGCWDAASKVFELEPSTHYLNDQSIWDWRCYDLLAVAGWQLGKKEESLKYIKMALKANPEDGRLQDNLKWLEENYVATQTENPS